MLKNQSRICDLVGVDFPLFAFTHHKEVVAAVSRAGGFGVLGVVGFGPGPLERELQWIDEHVDGMPYGVDLAVPEKLGVQKNEERLTTHILRARIPDEYWRFTHEFLERFDIDPKAPAPSDEDREIGFMPDNAEQALDVAFGHPIRLIVQALGRVPPFMIEKGRRHGVPVGALVGSAEHASRQLEIGVEVVIPQGYESGGHGAELSTMVLVPEVVRAVEGKASVLAAGGIVTGRQMAAAMAMGADGAWTGSVWLATKESGLSTAAREKLIEAGSRDTLKTRAGSGKMSRQTRSAWTEAWDTEGGLTPLPMPFQNQLTEYVMVRAQMAVSTGNVKARQVLNQTVGQGVGMMDEIKSAEAVVREFMDDFRSAAERLQRFVA